MNVPSRPRVTASLREAVARTNELQENLMPQDTLSASVRDLVCETVPRESTPEAPHSHPGNEPQSTPISRLPGKGIHRRRRLQVPTAGCSGVARKLERLRVGRK